MHSIAVSTEMDNIWAPEQNIIMISERSCGTEDWVNAHDRNDYILKYIKIENGHFKLQ